MYETALRDGFTYLSIQNEHIYNYKLIPLFTQHRDPFDRLLIAAANADNLIVATSDKNFDLYNELIKVIW